jgi:hypothetical protein
MSFTRSYVEKNSAAPGAEPAEKDFFIDDPLVRIHLVIEMIWWTGLAPWEVEFPRRACTRGFCLPQSVFTAALQKPIPSQIREGERARARV